MLAMPTDGDASLTIGAFPNNVVSDEAHWRVPRTDPLLADPNQSQPKCLLLKEKHVVAHAFVQLVT